MNSQSRCVDAGEMRSIAVVTRRSPDEHVDGEPNGLSALMAGMRSTVRRWFYVDETAHPPASDDPQWFQAFYRDYCNAFLWPLAHGHPPLVLPTRRQERAYVDVNRHVAGQVRREHGADAPVWAHDFHFLPLAMAARAHGVTGRIGLFHHAPVPDVDVGRMIRPLEQWYGLVRAYDHVGVQTQRDADNLAGLIEGAGAEDGGAHARRPPTISVRPVAPARLPPHVCASGCPAPSQARGHSHMSFLTAGRSDPIKGHARVVRAFDGLVDTPVGRAPGDSDGRAPTLQVFVSPSRRGSPGYDRVLHDIAEAVRAHNSARSRTAPIELTTAPVARHLFHHHLASADCLVLLPRRDGMNLIAKEYVMLRGAHRPGTLVLSGGTGAATELDAALVAPEDDGPQDSRVLHDALTMPEAERRTRWARLTAVVAGRTVEDWTAECLGDLLEKAP